MSSLLRLAVFALLIGSIGLPLLLLANTEEGPARTRQADIDRVRRVLAAQPELVLEAIQALQRRNARGEGGSGVASPDAGQLIRSHAAALFEDPAAPVLGNPAGDVTIVEFFDYRCPYCKQAQPVMKALLAEDPAIRVVHKHLPILGPDSVIASRAALAVYRQGGYDEYHDALMRSRGPFTKESVLTLAKDFGLDADRLEADMEDQALLTAMRGNIALAQDLNIRGTPSYVIGDALHFGAPTIDQLRRLVNEAREKGRRP